MGLLGGLSSCMRLKERDLPDPGIHLMSVLLAYQYAWQHSSA